MIDWDTYGPPIWLGLTVVLVALTVGIAIHGLNNEYKSPSGGLNRHGKFIAAGMVVLGVATLLSALVQDVLANNKARRDEAARSRQFSAEMARLDQVVGALGGLERDMRRSIGAQETILDTAGANLRLSEQAGAQARRDTDRVLGRVFDEGNRVRAENILLRTTYRCPQETDGYARRLTFWRPVLTVLPAGSERPVTFNLDQRSEGLQTVFRGLSGDLGPLQLLHAWRDARVTLALSTPGSGVMTIEEAIRFRRQLDTGTLGPDCDVEASLVVSGRLVANLRGVVRETAPGDLVVTMREGRVDNASLPSAGP